MPPPPITLYFEVSLILTGRRENKAERSRVPCTVSPTIISKHSPLSRAGNRCWHGMINAGSHVASKDFQSLLCGSILLHRPPRSVFADVRERALAFNSLISAAGRHA